MPEQNPPESSSNNPHPVEKHFSPETKAEKGFNFYVQNMGGQTDLWQKMIGELEPDGARAISGLIYGDTLFWSDEAVRHMSLAQAAGEDYQKRDMEFQTRYQEGDKLPVLRIFDYKNDTDGLEKYLQRNISPETPINVLVSYSLFADPNGERARRLNVGTGEV